VLFRRVGGAEPTQLLCASGVSIASLVMTGSPVIFINIVYINLLLIRNMYIYIYIYMFIYIYIYIYIYYGARTRAGGTRLVAVLHAASVIGCWGHAAGAASIMVCWCASGAASVIVCL